MCSRPSKNAAMKRLPLVAPGASHAASSEPVNAANEMPMWRENIYVMRCLALYSLHICRAVMYLRTIHVTDAVLRGFAKRGARKVTRVTAA